MPQPADVDELIAEGLTLYGRGHLDAALAVWERALETDPTNEQAASYVEYVREHYDMLTGAAPGDESDSPYAIEDDEYQIEIIETPPGGGEATTYMEPVDEGWALDDPEPSRTIEMEADEPPPVSFEDATREYIGAPKRETIDPGVAEFSDSPDSNPVGFSQQTTNIKPRNLGFVKPTEDPKPPDDEAPRTRPKTAPPELKMSLRTPSTPPGLEPRSDPALRPPPVEERTSYQPAPIDAPMIQVSYESAPPPDTSPKYQPRTISVELPAHLGKAPTIDIAMTTAPTTDLKPSEIPEGKLTRELVERETAKIPLPLLTKKGAGQVAGSPTRELGLREKALSKAPTTPLPMKELLKEAKSAGDEDTRTSAPPAFDPFDVRNAAILDEIDQGAPKDEAKDDRTRRRITSLLDRAADWHRQGENDRAVTAVDLALGEDPNSALAQKLIHRNRDTIMTVFQAFLGDLSRTPILSRPLHELATAPIGPRAAFLLSRIDGTLSIDETLDVSGMPRLEAYRYLCQLLLRGIIR